MPCPSTPDSFIQLSLRGWSPLDFSNLLFLFKSVDNMSTASQADNLEPFFVLPSPEAPHCTHQQALSLLPENSKNKPSLHTNTVTILVSLIPDTYPHPLATQNQSCARPQGCPLLKSQIFGKTQLGSSTLTQHSCLVTAPEKRQVQSHLQAFAPGSPRARKTFRMTGCSSLSGLCFKATPRQASLLLILFLIHSAYSFLSSRPQCLMDYRLAFAVAAALVTVAGT